eukprot:841748-Pyramimonas_sp.AAC.1
MPLFLEQARSGATDREVEDARLEARRVSAAGRQKGRPDNFADRPPRQCEGPPVGPWHRFTRRQLKETRPAM